MLALWKAVECGGRWFGVTGWDRVGGRSTCMRSNRDPGWIGLGCDCDWRVTASGGGDGRRWEEMGGDG